jgi:hypothetical protein
LVLLLVGSATAATTSALAHGGWRGDHHGGGGSNSSGLRFEVASLDGSNNNRQHPEWGQAGTSYPRIAEANYADGASEPVAGPDVRYVSNRIFNDGHQNIFSENRVSQWAWLWGQFIDHDIGLKADVDAGGNPETLNLPFNADDPIETFSNSLGVMPFTRSAATKGTGVDNVRQQTNTISSYINASMVYGSDDARSEWLREGPVDGDLSNNGALLLMPDNLLPRRDARGDAASAPAMAADGRLLADPGTGFVAGDVRANENIGLTAVQTLFAREHNRIVKLLPSRLTEEQKFQIARRVVIAEIQNITFNQFLPAVGIRLPQYRGYNPRVDAAVTNEFATVAYRAHSMMHGEMEFESDDVDADDLDAIERQGVEAVKTDEGSTEFTVPLGVAFFNPALFTEIGLGPILAGMGGERQYRNDQMFDNQLRSVLFQVPVENNPDCLDGDALPECFKGVLDLAALDIERAREHGMPLYNDLRRAAGLAPKTSFTAITGERTESFPRSSRLSRGHEIDDPDSIKFTRLFDADGKVVDPESEDAENEVVTAIPATTVAARLKAIYGSVDKLDAFVGMVAERHVRGTEFGELQLAMWRKQFQALRDGDRFNFGNDDALRWIRQTFGIDFRRSLAQIIAFNTDVDPADLAANVFRVSEEPATETPGGEETSASTDRTEAPTPSISPSGSVAGGVATSPRRTRRRVTRGAPRLRPA